MRTYSCRILIILAVLKVSSLAGQGPVLPPPAAPPESVVVGLLRHLQRHDWPGVAAYYDPAEVARFADVMHRFLAVPGAGEGLAQALSLSVEESLALSPPALFAQFLALGARTNPEVFDALKTAEYRVVGRVEEDAAHIHLVLRGRMSLKGLALNATELRSFRQTSRGWRLELPNEMQGFIVGLEAGMKAAE